MDFTVEYTDGIFVCATSGDAEVGAIADLIDAMLSHEKWIPGTPFVHDISKLDTSLLTVKDLQRIVGLAAERRALIGTGRIAVVASRDLEFGIARILGVSVSESLGVKLEVFRTLDKALAWLSVSTGCT